MTRKGVTCLVVGREVGQGVEIYIPPNSEGVTVWVDLQQIRSCRRARLAILAPRSVNINRVPRDSNETK